jgi:hypothetical protein
MMEGGAAEGRGALAAANLQETRKCFKRLQIRVNRKTHHTRLL